MKILDVQRFTVKNSNLIWCFKKYYTWEYLKYNLFRVDIQIWWYDTHIYIPDREKHKRKFPKKRRAIL